MIQQKQQQNSLENSNNNGDNTKNKRVGVEKITNSPRKKISKKDRHTKIETAQGPRDRRMRLSLNIARKFFDLQDMLGFDKASKTVEWLLTNSLSAISELSRNFQQVGANSSISSTSEIVVDELSSSNVNLEKGIMSNNNKNSEAKKGNKKVVRMIRPLAKESREKARERARERTMIKRTTLQKRRELAGATKVAGNNGNSLVDAGCWMPSTNFLNHQQNGGINHGLTIPELEHLSGNFGEACIW
ncbi:hypothetical protein Leryth_005776 [Lithospermum erythrorhizon]|nr:hypothetical protein Leryth_005776 [Lithospermum erythrorhizon]